MKFSDVNIQDVILLWLLENCVEGRPPLEFSFTNAVLEERVPEYGVKKFRVLHSPGIYGRAFRRMRQASRFKFPTIHLGYPGTIRIHEITAPYKSVTKHYRAEYTV